MVIKVGMILVIKKLARGTVTMLHERSPVRGAGTSEQWGQSLARQFRTVGSRLKAFRKEGKQNNHRINYVVVS